ncbi:hypothetical protein [Methylobacterium sp. Leaf118]|uniref:hypothetical protein n=1 Tax=Methylobacterium sp. Leaf118 TaxID=2876562 RepID=UPI001E432335|nr:hypothetical protein [Methylobacterium sp. Leaf118]
MTAAWQDDSWPRSETCKRLVAHLWARRKDTVEIAKAASLTEAEAYSILARIQDERHAPRQGARA